ncbi:MAG: helix-turn-helix transcriptional regulator [SAR324 cluster bacterium]|nr:helix-turn-helix transcriptional regulator [SAR324 cluster bacterium]
MVDNFPDRLRILLDFLGLKQSNFAEKLGISPAHVSKLLRGGNISSALIIAISSVFKVERRWLETGEGEMFQTPEGVIGETDFQEFVTLFKKDISRIIDRNEELIKENIRLRELLAEMDLEDGKDETLEE